MADCHQSKRFDNRSIFISNPDSEIKKLGLLDKRSKKKDNPMILENQINQNNRLIRKAKEKINCIETLSYRNLTRLDLSNSQLKVIPYSLQYLSNLEILNLDNNELSTLPEIVTRISCLKFLSLSDNKVQALPDSLGDLAALETLIVSSNLLRAMPKSCENLCNLKTLDVSKNYLVEIPRGMRNLEELDLSSNKYIKLSSAPMSKKLKFLYMRDLGRDINFPLWLFTHRVRILEILATDNTVFKHVMMPPWHGRDPEIRKLKKLSVKDSRFDKKFVEYFTSQTSQLESLKISNIAPKLSNNTFYDPPITRLRNPEVLTEIEIRGTGLVGNCSIIANCLNLVKLDVGNNNISDLSDDICQLKNLEILRVDQNLLKELPKNIGSITSLRELKASKNNIGNLPVSIQQFKNLNYLDLYENNIAMFPNEVRKIKQIMGIDLDQNYFKIENLFIEEREYTILQQNLRNYYQRFEEEVAERSDERLTGPRIDDVKIEHDWDSEDSAENFEPEWNERISMAEEIVRTRFFHARRNFRSFPSDLHAVPIWMERLRLRKCVPETEQGQFDYADDDE